MLWKWSYIARAVWWCLASLICYHSFFFLASFLHLLCYNIFHTFVLDAYCKLFIFPELFSISYHFQLIFLAGIIFHPNVQLFLLFIFSSSHFMPSEVVLKFNLLGMFPSPYIILSDLFDSPNELSLLHLQVKLAS